MIDLLDDCFGCHSTVLGASSVELPFRKMQHDCVNRQLQQDTNNERILLFVCITKISDR